MRTRSYGSLALIDIAIAEGDSVLVRCRVRGVAVNGGFLVGVQPTGKHFEVQRYKVRDGMITAAGVSNSLLQSLPERARMLAGELQPRHS